MALTLKETTENLFRLRLQAETERLDAPSELKQHRRLIARVQDDPDRAGPGGKPPSSRVRGPQSQSSAKRRASRG